MSYVDLKPIRAKIADTPEHSDYTSIQKRINAAKKGKQPKSLNKFAGSPGKHMPKGVPFKLSSYLELVELTGRCIRKDKRGAINQAEPSILTKLNYNLKTG